MVKIEAGEGNHEAFASLRSHALRTKKGIHRAWFAIGKDLVAEFNRQTKAEKSGRIYFFRGPSGRRRRHRASAPGETPANRTGNYRRSIGYENQGDRLIFGNSAKYAGYLEQGTRFMRPRPGLKNTLDAEQRNTAQHIEAGITFYHASR